MASKAELIKRRDDLLKEQSKRRERAAEISMLEGDDYTDEIAAEYKQLEADQKKSEVQLRAAIDAVGDAPEPEPQDSEGNAPDELTGKIQLRAYLSGGISGKGIDPHSAEGELNAELGLDLDMIPLEAFAPVDIPGAMPMRVRADAATAAPSNVGRTVAPIGQRVFADSILDFCQVAMPTVPRGERTYPVITAGSTVGTVAKGASREATAGTITSTNLSPRRGQIRYLLQVEDLAVMDMEAALRMDGRSALIEHLSNQALNGNGTAPNPTGFLQALTDPTAPTVEADFAAYVAAAAGRIDGLWASAMGQVRLLLGDETYRHAAQEFASNTAVSAVDYLTRAGSMVRATSLMPATDSTSKDQQGITIATGGPGPKAVLPVWNGLQMVRDNQSAAASGQIALTFYYLYAFHVVRAGAYSQVAFQLSA